MEKVKKGCGMTGDDRSGFADAVKTAGQADVCILVMGGANWYTGGEIRDRNTLDLMGVQEDLILEIAKTGKPMVVVLVEGRPVTMERWKVNPAGFRSPRRNSRHSSMNVCSPK